MGNHRVFKRWRPSLEAGQKWGVYSCPSLTELESHNNDGSECQSSETTHFWQGRRLRHTCKTDKVCARRQGQNARQCREPDITYDHSKKAITKHTCDSFKLAYTNATTLQMQKGCKWIMQFSIRLTWRIQYLCGSSGCTSLKWTVHTISCLQRKQT